MRLLLSSFLLVFFSQFSVGQQFSDVTNSAGIFLVPAHQDLMGGGVTWIDYDADGYSDIYYTGCKIQDVLFRNNGDGTFSDVSISAGIASTADFNTMGVVKGDINNDGFDDLFLTVWGESSTNELARNMLFLNNGDGTFSDISVSAGITGESFSTSACFLDVDLDGFLDIYVLNYMSASGFIQDEEGTIIGFDHSCYDNYLYVNNGDMTFTESASEYGVLSGACGLAVSTSDIDKDGDPDIQIANDFGEFITPNQLYLNNYPENSFSEVGEETGFDIGLYGMGMAPGDIDNDLDQDYYVTNLGSNSLLLREDENLNFIDIAIESGTDNTGNGDLFYTSWGDIFMDVDNDKYLDLFVANGHMTSAAFIQNVQDDPDKLYMNNGDLTFTDMSELSGLDYRGICRGAASGDYNKDGLLDIAVSGIDNPFFSEFQGVRLYENQSEDAGNWIAFTLEGTTINRNAYGSSIMVYSGDEGFYRELLGGSSHLSQNESMLHFGLEEITSLDSVHVQWIGGQTQSVSDWEINAVNHVIQDVVDYIPSYDSPRIQFLVSSVLTHGEQLRLDHTLNNFDQLRIFNPAGQIIMNTAKPSTLIDLPNSLSSGTYIAKLTRDNHTWVNRFIIL